MILIIFLLICNHVINGMMPSNSSRTVPISPHSLLDDEYFAFWIETLRINPKEQTIAGTKASHLRLRLALSDQLKASQCKIQSQQSAQYSFIDVDITEHTPPPKPINEHEFFRSFALLIALFELLIFHLPWLTVDLVHFSCLFEPDTQPSEQMLAFLEKRLSRYTEEGQRCIEDGSTAASHNPIHCESKDHPILCESRNHPILYASTVGPKWIGELRIVVDRTRTFGLLLTRIFSMTTVLKVAIHDAPSNASLHPYILQLFSSLPKTKCIRLELTDHSHVQLPTFINAIQQSSCRPSKLELLYGWHYVYSPGTEFLNILKATDDSLNKQQGNKLSWLGGVLTVSLVSVVGSPFGAGFNDALMGLFPNMKHLELFLNIGELNRTFQANPTLFDEFTTEWNKRNAVKSKAKLSLNLRYHLSHAQTSLPNDAFFHITSYEEFKEYTRMASGWLGHQHYIHGMQLPPPGQRAAILAEGRVICLFELHSLLDALKGTVRDLWIHVIPGDAVLFNEGMAKFLLAVAVGQPRLKSVNFCFSPHAYGRYFTPMVMGDGRPVDLVKEADLFFHLIQEGEDAVREQQLPPILPPMLPHMLHPVTKPSIRIWYQDIQCSDQLVLAKGSNGIATEQAALMLKAFYSKLSDKLVIRKEILWELVIECLGLEHSIDGLFLPSTTHLLPLTEDE